MDPLRVIGDADTVLAFALGGVPGSVAATAEEARAAVESAVLEMRRDGGPASRAALVVVTDAVAEGIRAYLDALMLDADAPVILEIPGAVDGTRRSSVERFVARVLGVHP